MNSVINPQITSYYLDTPLGRIRISGTTSFISEVHFLNDNEPVGLQSDSGSAFDLIAECIKELTAYFNGSSQQFNIPLNQVGTEFQQKVWKHLSAIRYGDTISYQAMARQLGDPKVIRAAAAANGRNNIAILVPCHRVIGTNGDLVGYAGGLWRKRWLLDHEKKFARGVRTLF